MLLSSSKVPLLISFLQAEFPDDIDGILGKSLRIFYKNLMFAISCHLSDRESPIHVTIPTGQLSGEELNLLEHMLLNAGWDIVERDRDYYKVVPGKGVLSEDQLIMKGELCPYCKVPTKLMGKYYECPKCLAQVECHPGTTAAMGFVANAALRKLRHQVHEEMDIMWKENKIKREEVYKQLRHKLGITKAACHVAKFDERQCKKAIKAIAEMKKEVLK